MLFDGILLAVALAFTSYSITASEIVPAVGLGVIYGVIGVMYYYSVKLRDAEEVFPFVEAGIIFLTVLPSALFFNEPFGVMKFIGLGSITAGVLAVAAGDKLEFPRIDTGLLMVAGTVITSATYFLLTKHLLGSIEPLSLAVPMYLTASATAGCIGLTQRIAASGPDLQVSVPSILLAAVFDSAGPSCFIED